MGFGSFFTRAIDTITPWDRGGEVERRKKREEEQSRPQTVRPQSRSTPSVNQPNNNIYDTLNNVLKPERKSPINIGLEPSNQVQVPQKSEYDKKQDELKVLTDKYRQGAIDEQKKNTSWFGRQFTDRNWDKRAELTARNRAAREYQEKHGYNRQPEVQQFQQGTRGILDKLDDNSTSKMIAPILSTGRVGTGVAQGLAGLYDLATPGEGQNRFTQSTTRKAEEIDQLAKNMDIDGAYRTGNVVGEIASYFTPALVAKTGKVARLGARTSNYVDDVLKVGPGASKYRVLAQEGLKELLNPANAIQEAKLTGRYLGQDSARGEDITARKVAENVAMSAGGAFIAPTIRGINRIRRGEAGGLADEAVDAAMTAGGATTQIDNLLTDANVRDILGAKRIPVEEATNIPIKQPTGVGEAINVRNVSEPQPLIREVGGDALDVTRNVVDKANDIRQAEREASAAATTPNRTTARASSGLIDTPKYLGEADNVKQIEIDTERAMLDEALANKEITKTQHKAANKALDETIASDAPAPTDGRKIEVQQPRDIPVTDKTEVPTGLPEQPGTVRATAVTDKQAIKTQMAAEQPIVAPPATIPKETQHILDNPKQYNKRQVAAARNQRKLAKDYAKAQEETSEQYTRAVNAIEDRTPSFEGKNEGFAPTGEFKKGKRGNIYEVSKGEAEKSRASVVAGTESAEEIYSNAVKRRTTQGAYSPRDVGAVKELVESGQVTPDNPLYRKLLDVGKESGTDWGKTGALMTKTKRGYDSGAKLTSAFARKIWNMAEDTTKVDTVNFKAVEDANNAFAGARDEANKLLNIYKKSGSDADFDAFIKAQDTADKANIAAKRVEYQTAKDLLKDNVQVEKMRQLERLASEGDLGKMDYVDSAMLSSTGTMLRNFVNSVPSMVEEGIFGRGAAKITNKFRPDTKIGGGLSKSTFSSLKRGISDFGDKAKVMKQDSGSIFRHPIENLKTFSTLGNETGDVVIDATARESLKDAYRNTLKSEGFTGNIEKMAEAMSRNDPQGLLPEYQRIARIDAGLGGGNITKRTKLELNIAESISNVLGAGKPTAKTDAFAKALTRVTIGFPGAVARATGTGLKRLPGGSLYDFAAAARATDNMQKALLTKQAIKQTGTGLTVLPGLFYTLGATGHLSGSYPTDPDERARWEREGISENSIKIGDDWYQFPAFLGAWSAPATFWGAIGRGENVKDASITTAKGVSDVLPTDQLSKLSDVIKGRSSGDKFVPTFAANVTRALTPAGALLNQVAKVFDSTKNDTNSGSMLDNFVDKVFGGIPGGDKIVDIPDKLTDQGEVIKNPDPLAVMTGASSTEQSKGIEQSKNIQSSIDSQLSQIDQYGLLNDSNLDGVLTDSGLQAYNKTKGGKKLDESDIKALREGLVKGVSPTKDTAYLERGQYGTNLNVLKLKRDLISSDKTVAPSTIEELDTQIRRAEMYKDGKINYKDVDEYKDVNVSEWRKMGDPDSDEYDPDTHQKLWEIDEAMAKNDASYAKGDTSKQKYSVKKSGSGSGRGRGSSRSTKLSADFGKLTGSSPFAPKVRGYQTMEQATSKIPIIKRVQPNIVHTIRSGRV